MHAPNHATSVTPAGRRDFFAGTCQSGCPSNRITGWFVNYRRVNGFPDGYEAIIELHVQDLYSPFLLTVPFVIDTATDVTIIPRRLIPHSSIFQRHNALGPYKVEGLTGRVVVGQRFRAAIYIPGLEPHLTALEFGVLKPAVVNEWHGDHGTLGLDALRRVVMVSDKKHVSLWSPSISPCQTD